VPGRPGNPYGDGHRDCPTAILVIEKNEMMRVLHAEPELSDRFMSYILSRNIRIEEDLIDQLFNSSEKRLARTLLLLSRYGRESEPQMVRPKVSRRCWRR